MVHPYPNKFTGRYKFVIYRHDGHGSIEFDTNERISGLHYRDFPVWAQTRNAHGQYVDDKTKKFSKPLVIEYIKGQIDLNPKWVAAGKKARQKKKPNR